MPREIDRIDFSGVEVVKNESLSDQHAIWAKILLKHHPRHATGPINTYPSAVLTTRIRGFYKDGENFEEGRVIKDLHESSLDQGLVSDLIEQLSSRFKNEMSMDGNSLDVMWH